MRVARRRDGDKGADAAGIFVLIDFSAGWFSTPVREGSDRDAVEQQDERPDVEGAPPDLET